MLKNMKVKKSLILGFGKAQYIGNTTLAAEEA